MCCITFWAPLVCVDFYVDFAFCFERFKLFLYSLSCYLKVDFLCSVLYARPIPVAVRSKAWVCGRSFAGIVASNPPGAWMSVSCVCSVLSGRGLCVGLITRP
jgi:hypothetical protein